jgi:hypothetical protein
MSLLDDIRARNALRMPWWVTNLDDWVKHTARVSEILQDSDLPGHEK